MNARYIVLTLAALALAAPAPRAHSEDAPGPSSAAAQPDPMAFVRGAQKWANTCNRCHVMRDPKEFDDVQWQVIVTHMRARAGLTESDAADIGRFLQESN